MNILLFGKTGQVGWELQRALAPLGNLIALDVHSTDYCGDFSNPEGVAETVKKIRPDVIGVEFYSNVNDDTLDGNDTIVSVASCTTNCLAPMAKVLHDSFGIEVGTMTTIHAYTGTQSLVDGPRGKDLRASRAAAENIIPHTTGAAKAIGLVIPELSGKLKGHAQRVPVKTGSVTELVSILGKKVTAEEVNNALKKATNNNESFGYTDEEIVSSDIIGSHFGSVFDATQTEITAVGDLQLVKTVAWYDNEYGFVTQLIRTLEKFAKL